MATDGHVELTKETLATAEGVNELNRMLRTLFDVMPGDGEFVRVFKGYGSPENVVKAHPGSIYMNLSGGASTGIYIKESATDATGWVAK